MFEVDVLDLLWAIVFGEELLDMGAVHQLVLLRCYEETRASLDSVYYLRYLEIPNADPCFLLHILVDVRNQAIEEKLWYPCLLVG